MYINIHTRLAVVNSQRENHIITSKHKYYYGCDIGVDVQVNTLEQGKTAVHVAVEEARLEILKVIIRYNPDVSIKVCTCRFMYMCTVHANVIFQ